MQVPKLAKAILTRLAFVLDLQAKNKKQQKWKQNRKKKVKGFIKKAEKTGRQQSVMHKAQYSF